MINCFRIRRRFDGKYLYQTSKHYNRPTFTERIEISKFLPSEKLTTRALNGILKHTENIHKKSDYIIYEFNALEKKLTEDVKNSKRYDYIFQIKIKTNGGFITRYSTSDFLSRHYYKKDYGKQFVEYSVAKNFLKYMAIYSQGWENLLTEETQEFKDFIDNFEIIPYILESVFKRKLLIEKKD